MPYILIYLIKVNIALLLFCLGYYFVLRRLTFYTLNRAYLITAIVFSSVYPLVDVTGIVQQHKQLVEPIQVIIINLNHQTANITQPAPNSYQEWLVAIFWTGVAVMALRLVMQLLSLLKIHRLSKPAGINGNNVRMISNEANPFSFWQSIYINPANYNEEELKSIIAHEKIHVSQWHTLDILLAELSLVFYWFNPGVWLIKRAVAENLEFITDRLIITQGINAKAYQYSLLYASFNTSPNAIVNHFNISTIKKRIMMMNAKKSSVYNLTRYGFIAPTVVLLLLIFGTSKAEFVKKQFKKANQIANRTITNIGINIKPGIASVLTVESNPVKKIVMQQANMAHQTGSIIPSRTNVVTDTPRILASKNIAADSVLYVIDGITKSVNDMNKLDAKIIEDVHVIKNEWGVKLFGPAASKGVVIVTTKAGKNNPEAKELLEKLKPMNASAINGTAQVDATVKYNATPAPAGYYTPAGTDKKIPLYGTEKQILAAVGTPHQTITIDDIKADNSNKNIDGEVVKVEFLRRSDKDTKSLTVSGGDKSLYLNKNKVDPLFILDGKEISKSQFEKLDQNRLESVQVFKDKNYTNKYGSKGENGVVILTTKKPVKN